MHISQNVFIRKKCGTILYLPNTISPFFFLLGLSIVRQKIQVFRQETKGSFKWPFTHPFQIDFYLYC